MAASREAAELPAEFQYALATLRTARVRAEVSISETPAPQRLAPHAVAILGDLRVGDDELATGRLVVLHDPAGQDAWAGRTRCVAYVRAGMEIEIAGDPLLPAVGWSWLVEALEGRQAAYVAAGGTVTRAASERFGTLAGGQDAGEFEVRASWSPVPVNGALDLAPHLAAWSDLMCTAAGLPPEMPGVLSLPTRRRRRV
ncbi:MAG: DUF3000 domain-containing protein [Frankiaceae bacterium]|jgi:hypothetical protein